MWTSSLFILVQHVLLVGPEEEMLGVCALWVVTPMTNLKLPRKLSKVNLIRKPMRIQFLSLVANLSIPTPIG